MNIRPITLTGQQIRKISKHKKIKHFKLPQHIKFHKKKLNVLDQFFTDNSCPYGSGLLCYQLECGFRVLIKGKKCYWLKPKSTNNITIAKPITKLQPITDRKLNSLDLESDIDRVLEYYPNAIHLEGPTGGELILTTGDNDKDYKCFVEKNKKNRRYLPNKKSKKTTLLQQQQNKCANFINSNVVPNYNCPLLDGIFDESGFDIDHIKEVVIGGNNDISNLQLLCKCCHSVKTKRFLKKRFSK